MMIGLERLSLNQATDKHLSLAEAVALCVRHDIPAIGLWRDRVAEAGLSPAVAAARSAGLHVSSLCRGGFFTRAGQASQEFAHPRATASSGSVSARAAAASSNTRIRCRAGRCRCRPPSIAKCGCSPFSQARKATPAL